MKVIVKYTDFEDYEFKRTFDDYNFAVAFASEVNGKPAQTED